MTDSIFDLLGDAADRARIERQTVMSRDWFRKHIEKNYKNYNFARLEKESKGKTRQRFALGSMYTFQYSAKYANSKSLPYWDKFPLVIIMDISKDHMLGVNLHYLHPRTRGVVLGKLLEITNNKRFDETTKIKLTYSLIKSLSNFKLLQPCIKKYIKKRILSKLILIDPDEWEQILFLPTHQFLKRSASDVWRESRKSVT